MITFLNILVVRTLWAQEACHHHHHYSLFCGQGSGMPEFKVHIVNRLRRWVIRNHTPSHECGGDKQENTRVC
eukprot:m.105558 g.105558  ORF g.105558 m.105558 type:complete len:72 (+) comp10554_c0_seq1:97-312(+)